MPEPICPPNYNCTFKPNEPFNGPWWEGPWGVAVGILAVVAITIIIITLAWWWHERTTETRDQKHGYEVAKRKESHELNMKEQETMQLDIRKEEKAHG